MYLTNSMVTKTKANRLYGYQLVYTYHTQLSYATFVRSGRPGLSPSPAQARPY